MTRLISDVHFHIRQKKIMSVSSDMSKNIRVGRSEKSFFLFIYFFLKKS